MTNLFTWLFVSQFSFALVPLESLILGDLSAKHDLEVSDPLHYIYNFTRQNKDDGDHSSYKSQLANYRGLFEEAQNLKYYCENKRDSFSYPEPWDKDQVKRSYVATLQYIAIDLTVRSISAYAREFEYDQRSFDNLSTNLVNNFCSNNLSIISKKQLKKLFMKRFTQGTFKLPSIEGNPLYPQKIMSTQTKEEMRKREFISSINLFKSFCSWSGSSEDFGLMVPFITNPIISSFTIRQLTGTKLIWDNKSSDFKVVSDSKTIQTYCQNLICRKVTFEKFKKNIPKSIGYSSLKNDFDDLYCNDLIKSDYNFRVSDPWMKKRIDSLTFDESNLLISHFISLITSVPDFLLWQNSFSDFFEISRFNIDQFWDRWAKNYTENLSKDLYYEEPLTVELVDRSIFYSRFRPNFRVSFDVNLGELDRVNQRVGKLRITHPLTFNKKYLAWIRDKYQNLDPRIKEDREFIEESLRLRLKNITPIIKEKIGLDLWVGDIGPIIVNEILEQLALHAGSFFRKDLTGDVVIPLEFNFAPYALRYLRHQARVKEAKLKEKREENLRSLERKNRE